MQARTAEAPTVEELVRRAWRGELDAAVLSALCEDSPELVSLALLAATKRIAEQDALLAELEGNGIHGSPSPSTPSGIVPIYTKPNTQKVSLQPYAAPTGRDNTAGVQPSLFYTSPP